MNTKPLTKEQRAIYDRYNAAGYLAILYPAKAAIAIGGSPAVSIERAVKRMRETLDREEAARKRRDELSYEKFMTG